MLWSQKVKVYFRIPKYLFIFLNFFQPLSHDVFKAGSLSHTESHQKNVRVLIPQTPGEGAIAITLLSCSVPETREELERQDPGHGIVTWVLHFGPGTHSSWSRSQKMLDCKARWMHYSQIWRGQRFFLCFHLRWYRASWWSLALTCFLFLSRLVCCPRLTINWQSGQLFLIKLLTSREKRRRRLKKTSKFIVFTRFAPILQGKELLFWNLTFVIIRLKENILVKSRSFSI